MTLRKGREITMDFLNRSTPPTPGRAPTPSSVAAATGAHHTDKGNAKNPLHWTQPGWLRIAFVVLLFSAASLAIALALLLNKGSKPNENAYINAANYQAVFLANGQVYFGKIDNITKTHVDLQDIYYLNTQQAGADKDKVTEPSSFSLIKLGCEVHGPKDQMIINRDQITFWENLKPDREVAKGIAQWQQEHPDGQKCEDALADNTKQPASGQPQSTAPQQTAPAATPAKKP